jgi:thioredoxin 1
MPGQEDRCMLLTTEQELNEILQKYKELFVLFYASWCPYSRKFLPEFMESALRNKTAHMRILIDDKEDLEDKYQIEVYPTVIYFKNGKAADRLNGIPEKGLNATKLKTFLEKCAAK